jgi:hypothetical protein
MAVSQFEQLNKFSFSVNSALKSLASLKEFSAWDFVRAILRLHNEYGSGLGGKILSVGNPIGIVRPAEEWINQLLAHLPHPPE